jgi:hypothetical protein
MGHRIRHVQRTFISYATEKSIFNSSICQCIWVRYFSSTRCKLKQVRSSHFRFRFPSALFRLLTPHVSIHQSESVHYKLRMQGRDSSVGIATRYGLESPPRWDEIFRTRPEKSWGLPSILYNEYRVSFPGGKAAGAWRFPLTPI